MTGRNGVMVQQYGYKAFGDEQYKNNTSAFSVSNRYTGQILDEDTGLYYYGARYYDPQLARFVQADSVVPAEYSSQALNRYSYGINNPLKFNDPTGQSFWGAIAAIVGWLTSAAVVKAIVIGASIGAGMAALTGGDVLKGALAGAIGGMFGVGFNPVRIVAGGAIGALVTGGDPMMGAMTAGIAAGVGACFEISPLAGVFGDVENSYFAALRFSTASGALAGGVTAEIFGGDFSEGAVQGAMGAAAGYVVYEHIESFVRVVADITRTVYRASVQTVRITAKTVALALDVAGDVIRFSLPTLAAVAGVTWNSPNTVLGLAYGYAGVVAGGDPPVFDPASRAIHFPNNPFQPAGTAVTLGNVTIYGKGGYPRYRLHEIQHIPQGEALGPLYLPLHIIDKIQHGLGPAGWLEKGPHSNPPRPWPWP
ncbi:MAG TPA: RHS repeat-associated core domain-containing protein [Sedimentisphaerales bacterium]|nr:RHS repeat-associated core domain-containing protein [Sedimentisphaerales bacterium]